MLFAFGAVFGFIFFIILATLLRAWVLTQLWAWFVVPLGGIPLTIAYAIGISLLVGLFTMHLQQATPKSEDKSISASFGNAIGTAIGGPGVTLLIGWIVTLFM